VFEPLVLEECGAQILRGIEDTQVLVPKAAVVMSCRQVGGPGGTGGGGRWSCPADR
jgi:hypothetical protein